MLHDPDLSAVVTRRIISSEKKLSQNIGKRSLESRNELPPINLNFEISKSLPTKKQKYSNHEYLTIEKESLYGKNSIYDVYGMLLDDTKKVGERVNITDTILIKTFAQGIFKFAVHELAKEGEGIPETNLIFFRTFANKYFDKIIDLESFRWIWSVDEKEGLWLSTCKKLYKDLSIKFFSDEKIILQWIENKTIKSAVRKIYTKYKELFDHTFANPDFFCHIMPILNATRF